MKQKGPRLRATAPLARWAHSKFGDLGKHRERIMKNLKAQFAVLLLSTVCLLTGAFGQITPSADAYTNSAAPATNYGANVLLDVNGATQAAYIQFNLASI